MKRHGVGEVGRFLSVGALNTVVGLLIIYASKWFLGFSDVAANALGYAIGIVSSFALNSRWTFGFVGPTSPAAVKFVLVTGVAYALNLITVMGAIKGFGMNGYLAQTLGIVPYTLMTFVASKYLVFRNRN